LQEGYKVEVQELQEKLKAEEKEKLELVETWKKALEDEVVFNYKVEKLYEELNKSSPVIIA